MNKVNMLVICRDKFSSKEEFEDAIKRAVILLLDNEYVMKIRYDEKGFGIVSIEYEHDDPEIAASRPYFLTPEQYEKLLYEEYEENES